MVREKKQTKNKSNNKSEETKKQKKNTSQPLAPPTKVPQGKRMFGDLKAFLKKQESISPPTIQQKFSLQYFLKNSTIQSLVLQCPNLQIAIQKINKQVSIERNLLYSILQKFFRGSPNLFWCDKYTPRNISQSFNKNTGEKIKTWLKSFNHYRNTTFQDSNSLIDDFLMQVPNIQLKAVRQNNWKLKGLIIKGRNGIGKSSLVKAVAKDIEYDLYQCGNDYNQIKYLKEKNQATQSQSVRTKINRNQNLIKKTNKSITTYAVQKQDSQIQMQTQKIQLMRDADNFYPIEQQPKFHTQLKKTIQSSKIPFIMTISRDKVSERFKIYDIIQFQQAKAEDIAKVLFLIYHIERSFVPLISYEKMIEKDKFKSYLNQALQNFTFNIETNFEVFINLTEIFNRKLDILFTFIQNSLKYLDSLSLNEAQKIMKYKLLQSSSEFLMQDLFYNSIFSFHKQSILKIEQNIESIDINCYMLKTEKQKQNQSFNDQQQKKVLKEHNDPTQMFTPQKQNQERIEEFQKTKTLVKALTMQSQDKFSQIIKKIYLRSINDFKDVSEEDKCYFFSKIQNSSIQDFEQQLLYNIPMKCHKKIRTNIIKNVKKQFYSQNETFASINMKQLPFIGFLIDFRSRASRKNKKKQQMNLKKLLKNNQINYLKTFTQIIKPGTFQ